MILLYSVESVISKQVSNGIRHTPPKSVFAEVGPCRGTDEHESCKGQGTKERYHLLKSY
jgi:hypothetical protein